MRNFVGSWKKGRSRCYSSGQAFNLKVMFQSITCIKRNCANGSRLPSWLAQLVELVDVPTPADICGTEGRDSFGDDSQFEVLAEPFRSSTRPACSIGWNVTIPCAPW